MIDVDKLNWDKGSDGLLPAVIQDADDKRILMLGYMNAEALTQTIKSQRVTFFSRSRQEIWVKGETSGNFLDLVSASIDCDQDTILIQAKPHGPVCHTGAATCFADDADADSFDILPLLTALLKARNIERPEGRYTTALFEEGSARIAQKVGEEGVELALARMKNDKNEILNESADLLFHMMVLLEDAGLDLNAVCDVLKERHITA